MNLEEELDKSKIIKQMSQLIARISVHQLRLTERVIELEHRLDLSEATASDFEV